MKHLSIEKDDPQQNDKYGNDKTYLKKNLKRDNHFADKGIPKESLKQISEQSKNRSRKSTD